MAIKALGTSLKFDEHIKAIKSKVIKTIYVVRKLNNCLPWSSFTTTYKSFVRPHLDQGDEIFDNVYDNSFNKDLYLFNTRYHWH